MIKNLIFDFGQVLVHFEPEYMTSVYVDNKDEVAMLKDVIFDRLYWDKLDRGTMSNEEAMDEILKRLPMNLHEVAYRIFYNWIYNIPEVEGMSDLVSYIKERYGVRLYVLSNISRYFAEHSDEIPILEKMDGCVFSAVCGYEKPNSDIYEHILDKFDLKASETLFVDDNEKNVEMARALGIASFLFKKDAEELKLWLDSKLG